MASEKAEEKANYYVSSLVRKLHSNSPCSVQKALISLTRATKKSENVAKFREDGGIKTLLQFIQTSNRKTVDLSVSVLANCALEKESRVEVTLNYFKLLLFFVTCSFLSTMIIDYFLDSAKTNM